jgi:hypothetical protein
MNNMIKGFLGNLLFYTKYLTGTTKSDIKFLPDASVATTGVNSHKLVTIGDETGTTPYGFGDVTKPTTGIMASLGRTAVATSTQTDTGLDVRVLNKVTNTGANVLQGAYIKAKNYSTGTVGSLVGLNVEVVSDGTVTNGAVGIKLGSDGTVLEQDIVFANGLGFFASALAITANSTATALAAGSIGITSHATGRGKLFVSDGSKWQFMAVA